MIPTKAIKSGGGRPKGYYNAAGDRLPSVTTILGRFKESGALMQWAFRQGQSGAASLYEKTEKAADVGSYVHDCVEADILDRERPVCPWDPETEQWCQAESALAAWREWREKSGLSVIHTELPLVSEHHQFGGTIDAVAMDGNKIVLLDWKTSGGVYADYLLQLAAYALLWNENRNFDHISAFHLVRFSKEGGDLEHRTWHELNDAREMFLLLRRAYDLDLRLKKRI